MTLMEFLSCILVVVFVFSGGFPGAQAGLTDDEKEEILNAHNFYRRQVNPIATNMQLLVWARDLNANTHKTVVHASTWRYCYDYTCFPEHAIEIITKEVQKQISSHLVTVYNT